MTDVSAEDKLEFVQTRLKDDPAASDLQVSLLMAAQTSYRFDTVLRPFPPMFSGSTPESRDYSALVSMPMFCFLTRPFMLEATSH